MGQHTDVGNARFASSSSASKSAWDHSAHEDFYRYYENASLSENAIRRFAAICDTVTRVFQAYNSKPCLDVADVGCGAGTGTQMWAKRGHRTHGVDINADFVELAKVRAREAGLDIRFELGSATELPWSDKSMDVCVVPELLEHVADWEACLNEAARVLRSPGVLYLSTSNKLCPVQQEFDLPLYSWYPRILKHHFERLAVTTRPDLVSHATYPAVNWFSFYHLREYLAPLGFTCLDRFDLMDVTNKGLLKRTVRIALRSSRVLRFIGHVGTPYTVLVGIKN
jgi:2-polyprenyl-6-hydroxyphenyl methylase/3-demethylubiquinone-9 3-methyltransferase